VGSIDRQPDPRRRKNDARLSEFESRFGKALEAGDPSGAEAVAGDAIRCGLEVEDIYSRVIAPAMSRIGHLWEEGDVSVGGEHLATAISQGVMARLFPRLLGGEERTRHRVILAATQGEHHVLGLKMIADTLEGAGYDVRYLGADVPLDSLLDACRVHRPAVLGLGASMPLNVPTLIWEVGEVTKLDHPPAIMVGGRAVGRAVEEGLNAPVVHNCEDVVDIVRGLIEAPHPQQPITHGLGSRVPPRPAASEIAAEGEEGLADAFSAASLIAADTAREAARNAFDLEELAYRDGLTGLWNRRAYDDRIAQLEDSDAAPGAALMLDIDNFKGINDVHGHEVGDEALVGVGRAILKSIRPTDFGARFGGDEFVVLLPGTDPEGAGVIAERIRATVEDEISDPPMTVSIGVAGLSGDTRQTNHLIDEALYEAKRAGRNQVVGAGV
jgi:diguanylate cyclase (GGDEF)-like protein